MIAICLPVQYQIVLEVLSSDVLTMLSRSEEGGGIAIASGFDYGLTAVSWQRQEWGSAKRQLRRAASLHTYLHTCAHTHK
jgi:hypothetical protein